MMAKATMAFCFLLMLTTVMLPTEGKTIAGRTDCEQHTDCSAASGPVYCCQDSDCCGGVDYICTNYGQCVRHF
uniref:Teretoxin Tsu11.2 n=2 Tax=Terebra subulata TaxID=89435 RepID=TB2_TERSU|nr:RecName: Full=Teretoxin Tsu11.2; Flags: Precursor [Terebra subulata]